MKAINKKGKVEWMGSWSHEKSDYPVSSFLRGRPQRGLEQPDPEIEALNSDSDFSDSTWQPHFTSSIGHRCCARAGELSANWRNYEKGIYMKREQGERTKCGERARKCAFNTKAQANLLPGFVLAWCPRAKCFRAPEGVIW